MYYRPTDGVAADVIPFYENGTYYLFYLKDYRDFARQGEGCPWHLLTTTDLVNYTDRGAVILRGTPEEQDLYVFTGSVFKKDGIYYIFYTGHNPHFPYHDKPQQCILRAKSSDLLHWEKDTDFLLTAPQWYDRHEFRDPFIYFDEKKKQYIMLLAARELQGASDRRGVTAYATSSDLHSWQFHKDHFYAPASYFTHECPDFFKLGDWYYLLFSEFSDKIATRYRMSKSPDGPWISPVQDTFDGHMFYAAKTCENSDGKRILFGWNCIRNEEKDDGECQWGGTIIPHEIVQYNDGTLGVKCPQAIADYYSKPIKYLKEGAIGVFCENGTLKLGDRNSSSFILYGGLPENCKISAKLKVEKAGKDFGLLLRSNEDATQAYKIKFEPQYNRLVASRVPFVKANVHCDVITERYLPVKDGDILNIIAIIEGSVLEVYVNGVATGVRMFDFKNRCWGFYAEYAEISVTDISINIC